MAPGHAQRPPSLLISTSCPAQPVPSSSEHRPSGSPFRYVQLREHEPPVEGDPPLCGPSRPSARYPPAATAGSPLQSSPRATLPPEHQVTYYPYARPRGMRIPDSVKPWLGIGSWAATSIAFLLAVAFWKEEVFTGLDRLSLRLQALGYRGYGVLFCLIFITTIPPFPLYSTLIILSGYTFGVWRGAAISYAAALSGAAVVFLLARHYLRGGMARLLAHAAALRRVVRAIEKRPRLLLLIRVAPYPYNVMNVLLASSRTLSFSTYFTCTALSLVKVVVHTSVGSSLHSFAGYHAAVPAGAEGENALGTAWAAVGAVLCVAILVYLSVVARRAVDDELGDEGAARAEEGEMARDSMDTCVQ